MEIELTCEKCGNPLHVSRDQAGRMAKCPSCGNDVYIPTPEEDLEELPLAPEDQSVEQREQQLLAERRRLDSIIAHEREDESGTSPRRSGSGTHSTKPPVSSGRTSIRGVVMTYLSAMRDSDLNRADDALKLLATRREDVLQFIDQLAADQIPPAEMANVPPGVYQGFLKSLRSRL